jgi:hypothetical protein
MNKLYKNQKSDYTNISPSVVENRNNYYFKCIKNHANLEKENPFTNIGLLTAIIDDFNDLRKKVKVLEMNRFSEITDNFIVKEMNSKNY